MRFLADENVPPTSIRLLRQAGHDVTAVAETCPGITDRNVLQKAADESRILLTFDRDYGELIYKQRLPAPAGLIYMRFDPLTRHEPAERLIDLFLREDLNLIGEFTVLGRDQVRQRAL